MSVFELGVQSLTEGLFLFTLLAEQGVFGLERVDGALEGLYVRLLALSRVLGRETIPGLTSFEASLALLVAGFPTSAGVVVGLGGRC